MEKSNSGKGKDLAHVAISGASGFIGSALITRLQEMSVEITRLVRDASQVEADSVYWNPNDSDGDLAALDGLDTVIHLAGESALGLWTNSKKKKIYNSRVNSTRNLATALASLKNPPKTLICASAVGFYGDRGDEELTEESAAGAGFFAKTAHDWEASSEPAGLAGIRVVNLRIGMVLDPSGAALQKTVAAFKLCLGGRFGSGKQYMSWITLDDLIRVIIFSISNESISGPINAISPTPITNAEYTKKLSDALNRPALLTVPEFILRLVPGGFAEEMLLASIRAIPKHLTNAGFEFKHPDIDTALRNLL